MVIRSFKRDPSRPTYLNTLGAAYCRCGQWDLAVDTLRRSLRAGYESPASDLYFLSICYGRLRDERRASEAFDQACYWHELHAAGLDGLARRELERLREEASRALALQNGGDDAAARRPEPP